MFSGLLHRKKQTDSTLKRLQETEIVLRIVAASLPMASNQEENFLNLASLHRAMAIVHQLAEIGKSKEEIGARIELKEKWIKSLLLTDQGSRGLLVIDGVNTYIPIN
ncbi:MAG: hypothetical protein A3A08_00210 [Candidatus Nealsonbacteria bacterium RIFCSPLOWO2_01_FULL_41_9]|uniref:Uncharacterized protein n=1 Tax=Candidatus Nealsonbacteria bacterium RIFCSPLOWO2_01_FULL_41_9 TaxID=1801671 RepID=A0A1G2EBJ7_9BACT|nr:MAG: hypothetical protein A3A08_00210 [Candidatus Nealsonbacteria bacterium RIFCSPLOWO2_01_FULL_41_9]